MIDLPSPARADEAPVSSWSLYSQVSYAIPSLFAYTGLPKPPAKAKATTSPPRAAAVYSSLDETKQALSLVLRLAAVPDNVKAIARSAVFTADYDRPYFPIPLKESELTSALKAVEASFAVALQNLREPAGSPTLHKITINHEKTTAFLFQSYLSKVGPYGKLDAQVKQFLKDTDLLHAQSDAYRRMAANLYETRDPGRYYHIHGSLDASTTLGMIGLDAFRPDLETHDDIVATIESHVRRFSVAELEALNAKHRQAGVPVLEHADFLKTAHGQANASLPPWRVASLETSTPPRPLSAMTPEERTAGARPLTGIKVLELCRIIAGPIMGRILCEYGADVLKITSPNLSDVPFFQVDCNMGKHAADLDLKTPEGRAVFEQLVQEADVVLDGYRPGALEKLGFGPAYMSAMAARRGYGIVYVNENCFGFTGAWADRPGWQQIADCATGVAWAQGRFMGLDEPIVPPFPISDYGTGCMGAIAALTGLYYRATQGGSWHGTASLLHYDLLLFKAGLLPDHVQAELRAAAGSDFLAMRHSNSVDQISGCALLGLRAAHPALFAEPKQGGHLFEVWTSQGYGGQDITVVQPAAQIGGLDLSFRRASRPNGTDAPNWTSFADAEGDVRRV